MRKSCVQLTDNYLLTRCITPKISHRPVHNIFTYVHKQAIYTRIGAKTTPIYPRLSTQRNIAFNRLARVLIPSIPRAY